MEDKFDTLHEEMKELMMWILASTDEEALLAVILDDEHLVACYEKFCDAVKEMKKNPLPTKDLIVISDTTASSAI
ncbi:hypothetical protein Scep_003660 [Stephania cephalantha]|uniref:Uncharacterized protein n=1 Tax=Stephania cephalantha TaxID=152367 RepID=A0AAP0KQY2_9MAGN